MRRSVQLISLSGALCCLLWTLSGDAQPARPREVTVAAMGDILLHIKVVKTGAAHGWDRVFGALSDTLRDDEIAFANLETPLVDDVRPVVTGSPPILGAPAAAATAIARAGIDVLGCANNHAFDQRAIGLARTVATLREAGIVAVGADVDEDVAFGHHIVERDGVRTAFLSYTQRINSGPGARPPASHVASLRQEERLRLALAAARQDADVVVLAVHWSHDFIATPRRGQRRRARLWVEQGADLILGTGPHVLQEVERVPSPRGEAVVAYSLGNLVSNQGKRYRPGRRVSERAHVALRIPDTRDGIVLRTRFRVDGGRISVAGLRGQPLWTANNFWDLVRNTTSDHDVRVVPMSQAASDVRAARVPAIRAAIGDAVEFE